MQNSYEEVLLNHIRASNSLYKARPLFLGGISSYSGGAGSPPGGYLGVLPQTRVAFDMTEAASSGISPSGSLLDNLNRIRHDIQESRVRVLSIGMVEKDVPVTVKNGTVGIPITPEVSGYSISYVGAFVNEKGVAGSTDIQVVRRREGSNINVLSTELTVGDEWYAADGVINTSNDGLSTGDILFVNVVGIHSGTAPTGLTVAITARQESV